MLGKKRVMHYLGLKTSCVHFCLLEATLSVDDSDDSALSQSGISGVFHRAVSLLAQDFLLQAEAVPLKKR